MKARLLSLFVLLGLSVSTVVAAGFTEPPITFYGRVTNKSGGHALRVVSGKLSWTIKPVGGGAPLVVGTQLRALGRNFSYRLEIPAEKVPAGFTVSSGTVAATLASTSYTSGPVKLNGRALKIVFPQGPAGGKFSFAENERGKIKRVDLAFSAPLLDSDDDGLPDLWETESGFNPLVANPRDIDTDGDGESDLAEFRSHTNPADPTSVVRSARALDVSTRSRVSDGDNVLIGGFIITGDNPKRVMIRGIGPSLGATGLAGALADPTLELFDRKGASMAINNDWKESQQAEIEATTIAPQNDSESAIVRVLEPGSYTAVLKGNGGKTGVTLVEVYDLSSAQPEKLANISTRGFVDTGDNIMIGGLIIGAGLGNNGDGSARLVVRAVGPTLAAAGIHNPLRDPTLELLDSQGNLLASNDNWRETQEAVVQATGLAPKNNKESAIVVTVPKGAYTAIMRGADGATGVGLVEVYNVP